MSKTLIIGAGYLGLRLITRFLVSGAVDAITRSHSKQKILTGMGCGHFARDITNSRFSFPLEKYDRVIINAAVTVDTAHHKARTRLYVNGTRNLLRQMDDQGFRGKCIIVGSTSAIPPLPGKMDSGKPPSINESDLEKLVVDNPTPAHSQYLLWKRAVEHLRFPCILAMSSGIYGPGRIPGIRVVQGLRSTRKPLDHWVNFIHVEDLCESLLFLDAHQGESDLFFISDGTPVLMRELYDFISKNFNLPNVEFIGDNRGMTFKGKRVDNSKILNLGFSLRHVSMLEEIKVLINTTPITAHL